jgi:integrase/recombinase XerD
VTSARISITTTGDSIKRYPIDLKEVHGLEPHTINLNASAITFFYTQTLKETRPIDSLPRMKTGRKLPQVYSEQEIASILPVKQNPKHRLLLMLAYGCGLRTSELRNLKPDDFEFDHAPRLI